MEITNPLGVNRRKIMAPCLPGGEVRSNWPLQPGELIQDFEDDEDKTARCRCRLGECCVDGGNYVIEDIAFNLPHNDIET